MSAVRRPNPARIIQDPDIMVGKPVVEGTRIPVEMVLGQLAYNLDPEELFARFPDLTVDDVRDCLAYAQAAVARKRRARRADSLAASDLVRGEPARRGEADKSGSRAGVAV